MSEQRRTTPHGSNPGVPRRANRHDWVSLGLLVSFGVMLGLVVLLAVAPYMEPPPLEYHNLPFPVEAPIHPGDPIPIHVNRCNLLDQPLFIESARTLRHIESGRFYSLPSGSAVALPGCSMATVTSSEVPKDAPPGTYQLSALVRVHGKFGRVFDVPYSSLAFDVVQP